MFQTANDFAGPTGVTLYLEDKVNARSNELVINVMSSEIPDTPDLFNKCQYTLARDFLRGFGNGAVAISGSSSGT